MKNIIPARGTDQGIHTIFSISSFSYILNSKIQEIAKISVILMFKPLI